MRSDDLKAAFDQQATGYDRLWAKLAPIREGLFFLLESVFEPLPAEAGFSIGDPVAELTRESEVCDLLVIGPRDYAPAGTVALGEVGEHLLQAAACPVLIVPNSPRSALADAFTLTTFAS